MHVARQGLAAGSWAAPALRRSTVTQRAASCLQAEILYALCEWRVHECPVVREVIKTTVRRGGAAHVPAAPTAWAR